MDSNSMPDGLRAEFGSIRSGTRQAYREKLVAESLLKQLRMETLDVLNKCRAEIDEFRTASKARMRSAPLSQGYEDFDRLDGRSQKPLYSEDYVHSLEKRVAELTMLLESNTNGGSLQQLETTGFSELENSTDVNYLQRELQKYKNLAFRQQQEAKISNNELLNLRSANKSLLKELNSARQEGSVARVRIIELEGLLEGLQQRAIVPLQQEQISDEDSKSPALLPNSSVKTSPAARDRSGTADSSSPVRRTRASSTAKEITELLANVDSVLSNSPQQSAKYSSQRAASEPTAVPEMETSTAIVATKLMDEFNSI